MVLLRGMSKYEIVRLGHPALRRQSLLVGSQEIKQSSFQKFLDRLSEICDQNDGVGIAAPQIGINKKVIVVHVDPRNPRYQNKKEFPLTIVINPRIIKKDKKVAEDWEGDLSCSIRALVPRAIACTVLGLDRFGNQVTYDLKNSFHARVFQHEIDHLHGIFLLDRVKQKQSVCEYEEWKKYWKHTRLFTPETFLNDNASRS